METCKYDDIYKQWINRFTINGSQFLRKMSDKVFNMSSDHLFVKCNLSEMPTWIHYHALTCYEQMSVQQFAVLLSLQLVGFVSRWCVSSLPVHPAGAAAAGVEPVRGHPEYNTTLQRSPVSMREFNQFWGPGWSEGLSLSARSQLTALWTINCYLSHQGISVKHHHIQAVI